ncbi:hypothetical protein M8818_003398 [Zalaria obscura]|uniref:Uncharacterized protein n=1 Tax=Zalaria obscura TaxID=2024903 RepID=A0ACC3SF06_9PEZI
MRIAYRYRPSLDNTSTDKQLPVTDHAACNHIETSFAILCAVKHCRIRLPVRLGPEDQGTSEQPDDHHHSVERESLVLRLQGHSTISKSLVIGCRWLQRRRHDEDTNQRAVGRHHPAFVSTRIRRDINCNMGSYKRAVILDP